MTEPVESNLTMPSDADLVAQTIQGYSVVPSKSEVIKRLPADVLLKFCLLLVDHKTIDKEAIQGVNEDMGEEAPSRSAMYAFAADFRERYARVCSDHRARIVRLRAVDVTDGDMEQNKKLIRARVLALFAEKSIDTQTIEELGKQDIDQLLQIYRVIQDGDRDNKALQLKAEDSERKQAKLEADLEEAQLKRDRLQQQIDEAQRVIDEVIQRKANGGRDSDQFTPEDIQAVREAVRGCI